MARPKLWETKDDLQNAIDKYFDYCVDNNRPPTIAGLAFYLDVDRQTIYNYAKNEEFFDTIKKARNKIMMFLEEEAIINGKAGTIFVMKQYGYKDRQEVDATINNNEFTKSLSKFVDKL